MPGGFVIRDSEVALTNAVIFNSVFNVNSDSFNNSSFQYSYPNAAGSATWTVDLQSGSYNVDVMSDALHNQMLLNTTCLIDAVGNNVFYISLNVNPVYYAVAVTCNPIPSVLPPGWSLPPGAPALPPAPITPRLIINNNKFGSLLGYLPGSYPTVPQSTQYLAIGTEQPAINPQWAFNVCLSVVNQPIINSAVPSSIFPFTFTVGALGQQVLDPYILKFYPCIDSKVTKLVLSILDQDNRPAVLASKYAQFSLKFRTRQTE